MSGWWSIVKDTFELLSYVVVVLGGPVAIWQYIRAARREQDERLRERRDRERAVYDALDERYLDYLRLCLEHPALDVFDLPDAHPAPLSPEQRKQEVILFTILISTFERAFLMYADESTELKKRQWSGWHSYMLDFSGRRNFQEAWRKSGSTFDASFQKFMEDLTGISPEQSGHSATE